MTSNSLCKCSPRRVPFPHRRAIEHRGGARGDLRTVGGPLGWHANAYLGAPTSPQVELAAIFALSAALSAGMQTLTSAPLLPHRWSSRRSSHCRRPSRLACKRSPRRPCFPTGGARGDLRTVGGPLGLHANAHLGAPTSPQVELAAIFELSAVLSARLTALMPEARLRPVLIALDCQ